MPPQPSELVGMLANQLPEPSPLAEEIAKASMFRRLLRKYGGPHVTSMVERIPKTAQAALELFGPQADVLAMKESSSAVARALQDPNLSPIDKLRETLVGSAYTAAAIPMMALPGTVKYKYRGSHQTPSPEEGAARLDDMTGGGTVFPDDIYSPQGLRYYGSGNNKFDRESFDIIKRVRNQPDAEITVYRAVPEGIDTINPGDFVTPSKEYATIHASSGYGPSGSGAGIVLSKKVKVRDVYSSGNDLNEFGYFPTSNIETSRRGNVVEISKIETPKDLRGKGLAEQELQNLVNKADDEGLVLALTPSDAFGASKSRLERWYKRHGFVRNTGRNKNFATRESYVRQPARKRNP